MQRFHRPDDGTGHHHAGPGQAHGHDMAAHVPPHDENRALGGFGARLLLLNPGHGFTGECHLDAPMVEKALSGLDLARSTRRSSRSASIARRWCSPSPRATTGRWSTR